MIERVKRVRPEYRNLPKSKILEQLHCEPHSVESIRMIKALEAHNLAARREPVKDVKLRMSAVPSKSGPKTYALQHETPANYDEKIKRRFDEKKASTAAGNQHERPASVGAGAGRGVKVTAGATGTRVDTHREYESAGADHVKLSNYAHSQTGPNPRTREGERSYSRENEARRFQPAHERLIAYDAEGDLQPGVNGKKTGRPTVAARKADYEAHMVELYYEGSRRRQHMMTEYRWRHYQEEYVDVGTTCNRDAYYSRGWNGRVAGWFDGKP